MKFKSSLAILSCAAIALSINVPSIAETVKDSQIKLEPTGIGNKDYRNKQYTQPIVGSWKGTFNEKGILHNIYINFRPDSTYNIIFEYSNGRSSQGGKWQYSNNVLTQINSQTNQSSQGHVKWISNNEMIITIIYNGDPYYKGVQRRYYRQQQPTSTNRNAQTVTPYNLSTQETLQQQNDVIRMNPIVLP